jgi:ribosome-associated protein
LLDIQEIASFTDYFIICTGSSNRMLRALADEIENKARTELNIKTKAQGHPDSGWITLDLGDIVVHFFSPEQREFYSLEELWDEGKALVRMQ